MDLNYNLITHEQLKEYFNTRLAADPRFAKMSEASIYKTWENLFTSTTELTNYYMMRTAQECFIDTARLESSVIKWCHNLCYSPKRAVPAKANLKIRLKGPLNPKIEVGDIIWFNTSNLKLSFNNLPYILDTTYAYTFTRDDIINGKLSTWVKEIEYSIPQKEQKNYSALQSGIYYVKNGLSKISIYQGEIKELELKATDNLDQFGESYQHYDIDDIEFSNFYGSRDPFANQTSDYNPRMGITKVGIAMDKDTAYNENIFDIELLSTALNYKAMKALKTNNDHNPDNIRVVRIKTNPDKTVRLEFGEGGVSSCGMKDKNEKLYIQYLATKGAKANKTGVVDSILNFEGNIYSSGKNLVDVTSNVEFIFTTNICNGADFEGIDSMKMNAKLAFASGMKLISMNDYIAFLNQLTNPFNVFASTAFGENEVMTSLGSQTTSRNANQFSNTILYSVIGNLYLEDDVINIYDKSTDCSNLIMYDSPKDMMDHIGDYTKLFVIGAANNFDNLINKKLGLSNNENTNTLQEMHNKISRQCQPQIEVGKTLYPVPPLVHYFDLVGNITLNKSVQIGEFKKELEKNLYAYFSDNLKFNNKIYKSAIAKKIYEYGNVVASDIDFVVSSYIKSDSKKYVYSNYNRTIDNSMFKVENKNTISVALVDSKNKEFDYNIIGKPVTISVPTTSTTTVGSGGKFGYIQLNIDDNKITRFANNNLLSELKNHTISSSGTTYNSSFSYNKWEYVLAYIMMYKFEVDEFEKILGENTTNNKIVSVEQANNILKAIKNYWSSSNNSTSKNIFGKMYNLNDWLSAAFLESYPNIQNFIEVFVHITRINRWNSTTQTNTVRGESRYWEDRFIDGVYKSGAWSYCEEDTSCGFNSSTSNTLYDDGKDQNYDTTGTLFRGLYNILTTSYGFEKNLNLKISNDSEVTVRKWDSPNEELYTPNELYKYDTLQNWMSQELGFSNVIYVGNEYKSTATATVSYGTVPRYYLICEDVEVRYNRAYLTFREAIPTKEVDFGADSDLSVSYYDKDGKIHYSDITLNVSEDPDIQDFGTTVGNANNIAMKCQKKLKTTDRAKNLPYELKVSNTTVHSETYEDIVCSESDVLFNDKLTMYINTDNTPQKWNTANKKILDTYSTIKVATSNTVLDENSNIVNYSIPSEISFIKIKLNYVPES